MTVTNNKVVSIHYHATDNDGNTVDSNEEFAPLEYLHGYNNILVGLEKALEGLEAGQEAQVALSSVDTYGEHDGKALIFWVKIVTVREAVEEELHQGHPLTPQNESCGPGCCC